MKQSLMPLSTEELLKTFENNQLTIMFTYRGHINEKILRSGSGAEVKHIEKALEKYSPIYANDLPAHLKGTSKRGPRALGNLVVRANSIYQSIRLCAPNFRISFDFTNILQLPKN